MKINWQIKFGLILVSISTVIYIVYLLIFPDLINLEEKILFYIGFIPIEVVFVTLILDQLLEMRDRREKLEKLNMVIGVFFSEVGIKLLSQFSSSDPGIDNIRKSLAVGPAWTDQQFNEISKQLKNYQYSVDIHQTDLDSLKSLLVAKRGFMVQLLENPVLLEHESFTELLRAVFHLTEELDMRKSLKDLPKSDYAHLSLDMKRAYVRLVAEWLDYMRYMKNRYPYLFSLAMRMNPFDPEASVIVK